jgi:hypothetical protein
MKITKEILENSLKNFNESHKIDLVYEIVNPNGTTNPKGLKIKNEGNSLSFQCNKKQALELLNFLEGLNL